MFQVVFFGFFSPLTTYASSESLLLNRVLRDITLRCVFCQTILDEIKQIAQTSARDRDEW